jgi:hypothetical protein
MQTFEQALRFQLVAQPKLRLRGKRLIKLLNSPESERKDRRLFAIESRVRASRGLGAGAIDWSKIITPENIKAILDFIMKIIDLFT